MGLRIPGDAFADLLMVQEFVHNFSEALDLGEILGSFCRFQSTNDVKQQKQKTEHKRTPNKVIPSEQNTMLSGTCRKKILVVFNSAKYNAFRYLQKDPDIGGLYVYFFYNLFLMHFDVKYS